MSSTLYACIRLILPQRSIMFEDSRWPRRRWRPISPLCNHAGMRQRIHAIAIPSEIGDFADEVRRVFLELGRVFGAESLTGECSPAVDVYETDETLDITVDVAGVDASALRIICKGDSVLIAGEKTPRLARTEATFH